MGVQGGRIESGPVLLEVAGVVVGVDWLIRGTAAGIDIVEGGLVRGACACEFVESNSIHSASIYLKNIHGNENNVHKTLDNVHKTLYNVPIPGRSNMGPCRACTYQAPPLGIVRGHARHIMGRLIDRALA